MAYDHEVVIKAKHQQLAADYAQANAEYEAARNAEDSYAVMAASDRMLDIEHRLASLGRITQNYVTSQQVPQGNRYGLSQTEQEVAHNSFTSDMTTDQKEELYARNRQKLQQMRATGQYRDDQGTVRR